jgi:hypothetical protein
MNVTDRERQLRQRGKAPDRDSPRPGCRLLSIPERRAQVPTHPCELPSPAAGRPPSTTDPVPLATP